MVMSGGIDWSEDHHDVAVVDADGRLVAKRRIGDDAAGFGQLLEVLAEAGDRPEAPVPVAIETARGCWWPAGAPPAVHLCHQPAGRGPLSGPPCGLGQDVRPRRCGRVGQHLAHRPGGPPAAAGRLRAGPRHRRAGPRPTRRGLGPHQAHHKLGSLLRESDPGLLAAFGAARGGILRPEARVLLAAAPPPPTRPG
jgi:Transposase